jgi:hypothetical protein
MMGVFKKFHNEELHNLYPVPDIISQIKSKRMRWVGHVVCTGEKSVQGLMENPEVKRPLGRLSRRSEHAIRMGLRNIFCCECGLNLRVLAPRS